MPYLKPQETDLLRLPSNETYWVRMRKRANWGSERAAQAKMLAVSARPEEDGEKKGDKNGEQTFASIKGVKVVTKMEWDAYIIEMVFGLITEWNLTDENDQLLDLTRANLDLLDPDDGFFLQQQAQLRGARRTVEAEKNLGNRSQRRSKVTR